ncbi:MAG: type II secretion system major pseudopilin GspG [Proteobacteria bacterium]|nr:type II secretion system major pseudopilin GspG [Pseudomonadota bacterium]
MLKSQWRNSFLRNTTRGPLAQAGMSMIEIMIVVSLIGMLMTYIVRNVMVSADSNKVSQTKILMNMLVQDLQRYRIDNNKYPTTDQGLNALLNNPGGDVKNWRGPYTEDNKLTDPWGEKIQYESDGRTVKMMSSGSDQIMGNEDDIFYPEAKPAEAAGGQ